MKSGKHIIILSPGFSEDESDENCIPPIQSFIKESKKLFPENSFSVIAFQYPFYKKPYLWHDTTIYTAVGRNRKGLWRIITWAKVIHYFIKIKSKNKPVVIHALWLTECYFIGLILSKLLNIKLVATVMGQDAKKQNLYMRLLRKFNSTVICCSDFASTILKNSHGVSCEEVIPFGIYEEEYTPYSNEERSIDIIGVGNIGPIKRFDLFIKLVHQIKNYIPDIYCELIGEGDYKDSLKNLTCRIKESGLSENIKLRGELKRTEVLVKMRKSKILLHTSVYEGQGYVYMEALASGMYIVSFDVGFLPKDEKVRVCKSESEMIEHVLSILQNKLDFNPVVPYTMKQSVEAYQKHYYN